MATFHQHSASTSAALASRPCQQDAARRFRNSAQPIRIKERRTLVHGYVAYDPLEQIYYWRGRETQNQLELVKSALLDHPPMGFKPSQNAAELAGQIHCDVLG
jgi:hypothetical protein